MAKLILWLGGRKATAVWSIILLSQVNLIAGLIESATWAQLMGGVLMIFVGGNVAQDIWSSRPGKQLE